MICYGADYTEQFRPAAGYVDVFLKAGSPPISRFKCRASGAIVWDSLVRGFGLRCQRTRKVYILKANIGGRPRWFSIGEHGAPWTPDTARAEAQILWGKIRAGEDLAAIREARRQRATVNDLCTRYLEDHAREHKKSSSAHLDERNLENHVRPLLGELYVDDVSRADIDRFKRAVKDGKTSKPGASNRAAARWSLAVPWSPTGVSRCSPKCSIWPSYGVGGRNILIRSAILRNTRRFAASTICPQTSLLDWVTRWLSRRRRVVKAFLLSPPFAC